MNGSFNVDFGAKIKIIFVQTRNYVEVLKIGLNLSMNETIDQDGNL